MFKVERLAAKCSPLFCSAQLLLPAFAHSDGCTNAFLLKKFGSSAALLKSNEGHDGRVSAFLFMALAPFVCLH